MRVLVATGRKQGGRESDFFWAGEGEMVTFPFECDHDEDDADGQCGCRRCMAGITSGRGTTTFTAAEVDITREDYLEAVKGYHKDCGWDGLPPEAALEDLNELLDTAEKMPLGAVLEKRGDTIQVRN